jgi:hypothetical protein
MMAQTANAFSWGEAFEALVASVGGEKFIFAQNATWVPAVAGMATLAALQALNKAWNKRNVETKPTEPGEVTNVYLWAKQANDVLEKAANDIERLEAALKEAKEDTAGDNTATLNNLAAALKNIKGRLRRLPPNAQTRGLERLLDELIDSAGQGKDHNDHIPSTPDDDEILPPGNPDIFEHMDRTKPHASIRNKAMDWEPANPHTFPERPPQPQGDKDSYITIEPPFIYDGTPEKWRSWYMACTLYFGAEQHRFRDRAEIPYVIINRLKSGTRASLFVEQLGARILKKGSPENLEFNTVIDGSFNCAQWVLKKLKDTCWTSDYERKMRSLLHKPLGTRRYDHWIMDIEDAMNQLDLPVAHVLPIVIENLSEEIKFIFCLSWQKTPDQFTWDDLTEKGPRIATMNYLRNREHHSHRPGHTESSVRGHAAQVTPNSSVPSSKAGFSPRPEQSKGRWLSEADFSLLWTKGGCGNCFRPGHGKERCPNERATMFTDEIRQKLRGHTRQERARAGQPFVPASNNPYGPALSGPSTGSSTPASSAPTSNYQPPSVN